jgi:hypothetical protein
MDSSPQGIKRVPSGGTGGSYDVLSPVGSHGMSLDYGKTTKSHIWTSHSHSQSKTSRKKSKAAWTLLRDNTPRQDSWLSLMQVANSKRQHMKVNTIGLLLHSLESAIMLPHSCSQHRKHTQVGPLPWPRILPRYSSAAWRCCFTLHFPTFSHCADATMVSRRGGA